MIRVQFVEPQTKAWTRWKATCVREAERMKEALERGAPLSPVSDLYKKQKAELAKGCFGKCVFCEKAIMSTQWGDVEHYRPKSAVLEEDWTPVKLNREGRSDDHPGYWWLAYDCSNLLLSCVLCNQVAKGGAYGKGARFPVEGFRAENPGEEAEEVPLLLHPSYDEPEAHLQVDATGICTPVDESEKGRVTRDVLGLNQRGLPHERATKYDAVKTQVNVLLMTRPPDWVDKIRALQSPEVEFAAVARAAVRQVVAEVCPLLEVAEPAAR